MDSTSTSSPSCSLPNKDCAPRTSPTATTTTTTQTQTSEKVSSEVTCNKEASALHQPLAAQKQQQPSVAVAASTAAAADLVIHNSPSVKMSEPVAATASAAVAATVAAVAVGSSAEMGSKKKPSVNDAKSKMSNRAGLTFLPGSKLEAKDFNEKWYSARVVETDWGEREVLIHFDKWSSRYDEWIPMDSSRLRVLQAHPKETKSKEFAVGERILATWADGKKYPAKVNAALGNDKYDVLFDDGYSKILKTSKMTKLLEMNAVGKSEEQLMLQQSQHQSVPQQQAAYVGSKQERRDKKRKHTVTELFHSHSKKKKDGDKVFKKQDSTDLYLKGFAKVEPMGLPIPIDAGVEIQHNVLYPGAAEEDYATYIGDLRVEIEDSMYKCPITGCNKSFRKENLLQMHIKHYHPEYSKFLGSTPNVADLAYARTIGESVEDLIPKKSRIVTAQNAHGMSPLVSHVTDLDYSQSEVDSKLENKIYSENNTSQNEDNASDQSNSCTMSPGTLFDMRYKEEKIHTGIKTLPPVRPSTTLGTDDEHSQYSNVSSDVQKPATPIEKVKTPRKRHQSESLGRKKQKGVTEHDENYDHFDDTILDGDDATDSSYKYNSISNSRSEMDNNDSMQSLSDNVMIINGEVIKVEKLRREEIINCTCGITEEDGLMIQCDLCLCWQHGHCNGIEKEKDVPEKYVCYICQHSYRQRPSKKYFHDQDWIREGKLPCTQSYPDESSKLNERTAMLKRSYDLVAGLLQIKDLLYSLRVKVNIAQNKDHPKLYLWAKNWSKIKIPEFKTEPVPIMEIIKSENCTDNDEDNVKEKLDFSFSIKTDPDQKSITSETELLNILEDNTHNDETKLAAKQSTSNHKDEGHILLDALTKHGLDEQSQQISSIKKEVNHDTTTKSNSSLQDNNGEKCTKSSILSSSTDDKSSNVTQQPVIPEPEAPIDPVECKLRLLEHIEHFQNYIDSSLTFVETQLSALEDVNNTGKQNYKQDDVHTKQTIQMILHDLRSMRKLAALC